MYGDGGKIREDSQDNGGYLSRNRNDRFVLFAESTREKNNGKLQKIDKVNTRRLLVSS